MGWKSGDSKLGWKRRNPRVMLKKLEKSRQPLDDATKRRQKREGRSSASVLETLQVIKPGFRRIHFSFHSSLRRHGKFMGNGELPSSTPAIPERSMQGSGLEALQCGSSPWIRISSHLPHSRDLCKRPTVHRPPLQQTKGQTFPPTSLICKLIIKRRLEGRK